MFTFLKQNDIIIEMMARKTITHQILSNRLGYLTTDNLLIQNILQGRIGVEELNQLKQQKQTQLETFIPSKKIKTQITIICQNKSHKTKHIKHHTKYTNKCNYQQSHSNTQNLHSQHTYNLNRLLVKYTTHNIQPIQQLILNTTNNTQHSQNTRELFIKIAKILSREYLSLQSEFTKEISTKQDHLYFHNYSDLQNQLTREFLAIIYHKFYVIKNFLDHFQTRLLTAQDDVQLKTINGNFINALMQYCSPERQDHDNTNNQYHQQELQSKITELQNKPTSEQVIKKKKKNRKKKNNQSQSKEQKATQNQLIQLMKVLENINISIENDARMPCNVTSQWLLKYRHL